MFYLQMVNAPIELQFGGKIVRVPKFLGRDFVDWAVELQSERIEQQMAHLEGSARAEFLALYPPVEPDYQELRRLARTPSGTRRIVNTCLLKKDVQVLDAKTKASLPPLKIEEVASLIDSNNGPRLEQLAFMLCDLKDNLAVPAEPEEKPADPLPVTGKDELSVSPGIGQETSVSGTAPTNPSTR